MAHRRFFVDAVHGGHAEVNGADAEHLARVLRAEPEQKYELSDGDAVYLAEILQASRGAVRFRILERVPVPGLPARITLLASLIRFERFEWIIGKATELGVETIAPIIATRSEKGLELAAARRVERWRRIAHESSQQSRRVRPPSIEPVEQWKTAAARSAPHRYFLEENPGAPGLLDRLPADRNPSDEVALAVGPEGGWTDGERSHWGSLGWTPVSLGPTVLRAETAALAALAIISHAWPMRAADLLK